jgi:LCP family protein required for cell wall assembly
MAILLTAGTVGAAATVYVLGSRLADNVQRLEGAFDGLAPTRDPAPNPATPRSRTILAVGSDLRADGQSTGRDAAVQADESEQRTDAIMLLRFDPAKDSATVVSIPRDSWVSIPGHGRQKINAAYPLGGPPLLIRTVERLTGIRVDNFMIIDFAGFRSVVDALGGVQVQVAQAVTGPGVHFRQGTNDLDGTQALAYVRQRQGLPRGDLDRVRRQQNVLRAILVKVAATKPSGDPRRTYRLLDAVTRSVSVDDGFTGGELRGFALDAARLRQERVWFLTAAVRGGGWEGDQSVIYLDDTRNAKLWAALGADTMAEYVESDPAALLTRAPR